MNSTNKEGILGNIICDQDNNLNQSAEISIFNKCGEIYFENDKSFLLICALCKSSSLDIITFSTHFMTKHAVQWSKRDFVRNLGSEELISANVKENEEQNSINKDVLDLKIGRNIDYNKKQNLLTEFCKRKINKKNAQNQQKLCSTENVTISDDDNFIIENTNNFESDGHISDDSKVDSQNYLCKCCIRRFDSLTDLQQHEEIKGCDFQKTQYLDLNCKKCNVNFTSRKILNQHNKSCKYILTKKSKEKNRKLFAINDLTCDACNRKLPNKSSLLRHKSCHLKNSERPYKCTVCSKGFNTIKNLENHKKIHDESRIYECDFCYMKFKSKISKNDHQKEHSEKFRQLVNNIGKKLAVLDQIKKKDADNLEILEINYSLPVGYWRCDICEKMFKNSYKKEEHKRFHAEIKPFICEICGKDMASQQILNYHLLVHNRDRRFKCTQCGTGFFTPGHLKRHVQTSCNSEKLFQCEVCQYRFTRKEHLISHLLTHEKNRAKNFKCELCTATYLTLNSLRVHKKKHMINTEGPFNCNICLATFPSKISIRRHEKRHKNKNAFKCEHCGKRFNDIYDMKQHVKRQHL